MYDLVNLENSLISMYNFSSYIANEETEAWQG